jgi:hypothetical protein
MKIDFGQVELRLLVNLTVLREVLKLLSIDGKKINCRIFPGTGAAPEIPV